MEAKSATRLAIWWSLGIKVSPGSMYANSARFDHCLRLSCGGEWDPQTAQALKRLGQLAAAAGPSMARRQEAAHRSLADGRAAVIGQG